MDSKTLKENLNLLNIDTKDYSLDGTLLPMRTILSRSGKNWITFEYDEHGRSLDRKEFIDEKSACEDILKRLLYLVEWRKKYNVK